MRAVQPLSAGVVLVLGACVLGSLAGCQALDALAGGFASGQVDPTGAAAAGAEAAGASGSNATLIAVGISWAVREAAGAYLRWRGKAVTA